MTDRLLDLGILLGIPINVFQVVKIINVNEWLALCSGCVGLVFLCYKIRNQILLNTQLKLKNKDEELHIKKEELHLAKMRRDDRERRNKRNDSKTNR